MPFGLKNAGETYQRAMVTLFHDMMHKEIEVYVDDMITKSKEGEDHRINSKRLFDRLKEYELRLNPAKCTFGSKSGKLLRFVVSERGIEVDPDKVKAIRELPPPSSFRENAVIEWDEECQKAFDTIKAYLVQPPVLVLPTPDRPLILYLTVRRQSLGQLHRIRHRRSADIPWRPLLFGGGKDRFPLYHNVAEYEACILGLQAAIDFKIKELDVFGDSMLTIFQTLGQWKTKDAELVPYH
ncbi:hypothetical protein CRG98_004406 [Punica granatum]|uniref:Reverse transcriptase domain-containing protein n=1 Tax=Punica granatum TaxID=22663 RepID=A0A2I0L3B6_PUNGR|nr:hypothetical protein CRG98_004406 [Punica granatum]